MAKGLAKAQIIGNLTRDIEVRTTPSGKKVGNFTIAVSHGEGTSFIDCVSWEKTADLIKKYTGKGDKLYVEGNIQQQSWTKDGDKRSKLEVIVRGVIFLQTKGKEADDFDVQVDLADIPF